MPINKETILSVFDEELTLMQWLKTINKALDDAVLTGVTINKKGNATLSFVFTFEDGTTLETGDIVLQQGESINGADISNGHLYLSLTNGDELDAGELKYVTSFEINESQHLIVNYGDGTNQDLGSLGDFSSADFVTKTLKQTSANWTSTFNLSFSGPANVVLNPLYSRIEVLGNILYIVCNYSLTNNNAEAANMGTITSSQIVLPQEIGENIYDLKDIPVTQPVGTDTITPIAVDNVSVLSSIEDINYENNINVHPKILFGHVGKLTGNRVVLKVTRNASNDVMIPPNTTWYFCGRMFLTLI